ncbi:MAG: CheB methylesterase domain-containing protein, partial [Myxococcota bacterium]
VGSTRGPMRVVAIGASTGGPPALQHILGRLPGTLNASLVVAQHMPERFTQAFAERLDRAVGFHVRQAEHGDVLERGTMLLAPGGRQMELVLECGQVRVNVREPESTEVYVPCINALLRSVAKVVGESALGIILTGMGRDGSEGLAEIKDAGGSTLVEAESTAVVYGMPAEAIETGRVDAVLPLDEIPGAIIDYVIAGSLPRSANR